MNPELRRAMRNATKLVAMLEPGGTITRERVIDVLREPDFPESEGTVRHGYRHYVIRGGITNADAVITYQEAGQLSGSTIDSLRSAAYRGQLVKLGTINVEGSGRERRGITLRSLAEFKRWTHGEFEAAALQVAKWREAGQ